MADGIHPTGPAQPTLDQSYTTAGNPASTEPSERREAQSHDSSGTTTATRGPTSGPQVSSATPSSLGLGVRDPNAKGETSETHESMGRHNELEAEQMAAPGEGRIADAVDAKPGASGAQPGLESDLDRKKAEQAPLREAKKEERKEEVDVGGILGQRGGPANPVDQDGYPNAGS